MRQALSSGVIDAYISERPEAMTAEAADSHFKMITLKKGLLFLNQMPLSLSE